MTGEKIIKIAKKYLGDNGKKFCKAYGVPFGTHWCVIFGWYVFKEAKSSMLYYGGKKTAYVPNIQAWLHAHCEHVSMKNAKPGDLVIFTWSGNGYNREQGSRDHIGFIYKKGTSSTAYTLEGNTGTTSPKTSKVMLRERPAKQIYGIYRPKYKKTKNTTATQKKSAKSTKKGLKTETIKATYKVMSRVGMNIRKSPSLDAKIIGCIAFGKKFKATKKSGDWIYGKYGKLKGWICTKQKSTTYMKKCK